MEKTWKNMLIKTHGGFFGKSKTQDVAAQ